MASYSYHLSYLWTWLSFYGILNNLCVNAAVRDVPLYQYPSSGQVHRTWSEWSGWSDCSRTCGGGVRVRTRVCKMSMVTYINLQKTCVGETTDYELCEKKACSPHDEDFLDYQCSRNNGRSVAGRQIDEWIPFGNGKNPCELQCRTKDQSLAYSFGKVIDGTKCIVTDRSEPAICVNGRCMEIDCAGQLGSDNRRDHCGVCRGDNSTCHRRVNTFRGRSRTKVDFGVVKDNHYDYNEIAVIPSGATHILVKENSKTNFLVLVDHRGSYYVNGNWRVESPGRFNVHGTDFVYNRTWDGREVISANGPTRFALFIFVLGTGNIPTVDYEYWLSESIPSRTRQALHSLNDVKTPEAVSAKTHHDVHNSEISGNPANKALISKIHGYKSFYHRNEILKSVPSWSIKRHRSFPINVNKQLYLNKQFTTQTSINVISPEQARYSGGHFDDDEKELVSARRNSDYEVNLLDDKTKSGNIIKTSRTSWPSIDEYGRPNVTSAQLRGNHRSFDYSVDVKKTKVATAELNPVQKESSGKKSLVGASVKERKGAKKKRKRKLDKSECQSCSKAKHQTRNFCSSDFVLRAVVVTSEKHQNTVRYELNIIQSYRNKVPILSKEYVWTTDPCRCPRLRTGREYILMGHSTVMAGRRKESKLNIDKESFVRRYTQKRARTMQRLVRDQDLVCKRFVQTE